MLVSLIVLACVASLAQAFVVNDNMYLTKYCEFPLKLY